MNSRHLTKFSFPLIAALLFSLAAPALACDADKSIVKTAARKKAKPKILFIAGTRSHGWFNHEHYAGSMLLAKAINDAGIPVETVVIRKSWPADEKQLEGVATIVVFCTGGRRHLLNPHIEKVDAYMKKGVGLVCLHYGVETNKGKNGDAFLRWMGGYFETHWSVNPHWVAEFKKLPNHPIARGVKPFTIYDEWYYHMRFSKDMKNVTPILSAHPPKSTLRRRDGAHSGNPHVRKAVADGKIQHVAWAFERPGGGRGFGFTGAHFHINWAHDQFRKVVLNAIVWTAKIEVPKDGVPSKRPDAAALEANQTYRKPANWNSEKLNQRIKKLNEK